MDTIFKTNEVGPTDVDVKLIPVISIQISKFDQDAVSHPTRPNRSDCSRRTEVYYLPAKQPFPEKPKEPNVIQTTTETLQKMPHRQRKGRGRV